MVERLKQAIEKARAQRAAMGEGAHLEPRRDAPPQAADLADIPELTLDPERLRERHIIADTRNDGASVAFNLLRTRLLRVCLERGWRRIGITSPTKGCGKTLLTANIAFSIARNETMRVLAVDLDLRVPSLGQALGVRAEQSMAGLLRHATPARDHLRRVGRNLFFALNDEAVRTPAELLQTAEAGRALAELDAAVDPVVTLCDMPPVLLGDDALAALAWIDAVVVVAAAGATTARQLEECERQIGGAAAIIGVVLNKAEGAIAESYSYN